MYLLSRIQFIIGYIVCGFIFIRFHPIRNKVEPSFHCYTLVAWLSRNGQIMDEIITNMYAKHLFYSAFIYLRNSGKSRIYAEHCPSNFSASDRLLDFCISSKREMTIRLNVRDQLPWRHYAMPEGDRWVRDQVLSQSSSLDG